MNIIVLGPPGSGKGTQAKKIAQHFGLNHVSTGELLRLEAEKDTPKAKEILSYQKKGVLVPLEIVLEVTLPSLQASPSGFVLDGTPRNFQQAQRLNDFLAQKNIQIDRVILLELSDEEAISRLLKRAKLEGRSDDNEVTIRERFRVYHDDTEPVIALYEKQGKLLRIDGRPDIETIFQDILKKLTQS